MEMKFSKLEFENAKSIDKLPLICVHCDKTFFIEKRLIKYESVNRNQKGCFRYCSQKCKNEHRSEPIHKNCGNCMKEVITRPRLLKKSKSGNVFCSRSCATTYNNTHKKTGNRRSKMEVWIEDELKRKYDFEIIFNGKEVINSELDIYIPSLKLAFELNGIFHYEPIYGIEKLNSIKNNEDRKFQACLENKIELCIIDASGSKNFKPERDRKYLDIIQNIIENKIAP